VRTMVTYGYKYIPFSWDELDKKPEMCRRAVYEMLGRFSRLRSEESDLTVKEREILRYVVTLNRPFRLNDVRSCLQLGSVACRRVIRGLMDRKLIKPLGDSMIRNHQYILQAHAVDYLL
jgi:hypothetical protein